MPSRRTFLGAGGAVLLGAGALPWTGGPLGASPRENIDMSADTGLMRFAVDRGGSDMGHHELRFERRADGGIDVTVDIDLSVDLGPLTLFRYTHNNRTTWRDGRILKMRTKTNDDGDRYRVEATRQDDGSLAVTTGQGGTRTVSGDLLPTTYWISRTIEQKRLLNTQEGDVAEITVRDLGTRSLPIGDRSITAQGYQLSGDLELKVWYDQTGRWVGMSFDGRGKRVTYTLKRREGFIPTQPTLDTGA